MVADIELVSDIVSAYVANNSVSRNELGALIAETYTALSAAGSSSVRVVPAEKLVPAVSIKKSITPDAIICLEDGKAFKSHKRHLGKLGMTPKEYREKWGLPTGYPMVAPAYAEQRSALAKSIGLGRKPAAVAPKPAPKEKAAPRTKRVVST